MGRTRGDAPSLLGNVAAGQVSIILVHGASVAAHPEAKGLDYPLASDLRSNAALTE